MSLFKEMFNDFSHSLSDKEVTIFNFIESNILSVRDMKIRDLSLKLNISEYSINKFCKKLNIDNFENLLSVVNELSKNYSQLSNIIFNDTINNFSNFINKIDENKITQICKLILKYQNLIVLFSDSSKFVAQYLSQNFKNLNINCKLTSSPKQAAKQQEVDLIMYLESYIDEKDMVSILKNFSNKIIIMVSTNVIKNVHDNCSVFVHIENQKTFRNFNVNSMGLYFILCDLIISKIIELLNLKN